MDAPAGPDFFDLDYPRLLAPLYTEAETRREVAAARDLAGLAQDDRVLDLGCGWGRHLAPLERAGHDVVGLDLSLPLLRRAAGDGDPRGLRLVCGDMLRLPFRDAAFDAVLNLATSLGLFLEDGAAVGALAEARRVLRSGGRVLLEGMHRDDAIADYAARDGWTLDDGTEVEVRRRLDPLRGVSHERLRWRSPDGRAGEKRHSLRLRTATELVGLVERAGLRVEDAWGDWSGAVFRHDSPRIILLARATL